MVTQQLLDMISRYPRQLWKDDDIMIKRGDILALQGSINQNVYLVTHGALHLYHESASGSHTIRFAYRDSVFALLDSLITGQPTAYTAQAIRKTTLKVMRGTDFMEFVYSSAEAMQFWNKVLSYTVIAQLERETDLLNPSPKERYQNVLKRSPHLFREVPHKYIASYLRMAPETLSRLLKS